MAQLNLFDTLISIGVLGFLLYGCVLSLATTAVPAARELAHALRAAARRITAAARRTRRTDHN